MSIVLFGSTGFLGSRLRPELERLAPVVGVARRPTRAGDRALDLSTEEGLAAAVDLAAGKTVVYCVDAAGGAARGPGKPAGIKAQVPGHLARAARRMVYVSGCPRGIRETEQGVLAGSSSSLIVRVCGLYDESGTPERDFAGLKAVQAADDFVLTPTFVPDLAAGLLRLMMKGETGIRHAAGGDAISEYEFLQLASLAWGFDVWPTACRDANQDACLASDVPGIRTAAEVFAAEWARRRVKRWRQTVVARRSAGPVPAVVLDTVGVVLGARTWLAPDDAYWRAQDELEHLTSDQASRRMLSLAERAYAPNPYFWRVLRHAMPGRLLVLANNGPWNSFAIWVRRYGLDKIFDCIINSERDRVTKPSSSFFLRLAEVEGADPSASFLVDDRLDIVSSARTHGWKASCALPKEGWPVASYELPGLEMIMSNMYSPSAR
jgi:FMN phosphatase YigB (HAD superfamily)/dTDP-4-dehydrorhamnose reductase